MTTRAFPSAFGRTALPSTGLTEAECFAAARAARGLPGAWWVQRDEDERGHASLSLVPDDGGPGYGAPDEGAPTFLLWREDGPVRLARGWGASYADLGIHADVHAAMAAVRRALETAEVDACRVEGARRTAERAPWPPHRRRIGRGFE